MIEVSVQEVSEHPDYQVLNRISTSLAHRVATDPKQFIATIIDLETMGLNATQHEILEIGMLSFSFSTGDGIIAIVDSYNELNDPGKPIPAEVIKVTGITDADVKGKAIDWNHVAQTLKKTHLIICHNSGFDRNFLELQTPEAISTLIKTLPFACTIRDIDWKDKGIESSKLDYINWKLGFFYEGHRALNDCWATLNPLIQCEGTFEELKVNVRKKETLICAVNAPFDKKDLLKGRNYRWSDGTDKLPKSWWISLSNELLTDEKLWLDEEIYGVSGASNSIPQIEITARKRYSFRAQCIE
ncbi:DNA polymerase III subunit epsilon (plasmid) [Legionella antarctica]|uniref:DNA polymerase III subunit epsilon n=1 Tax=Legionella antarctica TaxID=2708020 RepID=A0A6F8TAF4_9GAMM|nr:3'-5' exonuclease [Legionella antarctica]BCA97223.1 DNA polymerase III subunit epsilon [Legionella antarctica]